MHPDMHYDFVIIGAGPAGEAAAYMARSRGASVAVVDRDLFGGSCPHWGCVPSKSLLNAAALHAAGGDYPWRRASDRRDYMINRVDRDYPDDTGHVRGLRDAGAETYRGEGRLDGPGRVVVRHDGQAHALEARHVVVAIGSETQDAADRGHRHGPYLDQPGRDGRPRAAGEPPGARRRSDGRRARPGLRAVRRPRDDRPVRARA